MKKSKKVRNTGWVLDCKKGIIGPLCKTAWMLATEVEPLAIVEGYDFHSSTINYVANKMYKMVMLTNKKALEAYIHIGPKDASAWGSWKKYPELVKSAKRYQSILLTIAKTRL